MGRPIRVTWRSSSFASSLLFVAMLVICVSSLAQSVNAISVNPARQQLANPTEQSYTFVYSVINNDPMPRTITVALDRNSAYLKDRVTFSKEQFSLLPGQADNIQVVVNPAGLGPETHTLVAGLLSGGERVGQLELLIIVPGTPVEHYDLAVKTQDTATGSSVPITVTLGNSGNIIGYARVRVDIIQKDQVVGSTSYPDLIQVLPGKSADYELPFNVPLDPGFYTAKVYSVYSTTNNTAESQFSVELASTKQTIGVGEDLTLTFASLNNPPAVTYKLKDGAGKERASGTFLPQTGDIIIPMSTLVPGDYVLALQIKGTERLITVSVVDKTSNMRYFLVGAVVIILVVAILSLRQKIAMRLRVWQLTWAVAKRSREVTNLINRSHKLVDEYAKHARNQHAAREARAPSEGSR